MSHNKIISSLFVITALFFPKNMLIAQELNVVLRGAYLGQHTPPAQPEIFAPGIVSKGNEYEFGSVFSAKGNEFFFAVNVGDKAEIRYMVEKDGIWLLPKKIELGKYSYNDPFLSPDEERLYYISDSPLDVHGVKKDIDIWYSERTDNGWSEPINAGSYINSDKNEYYISFSNDGTIYFASNKEATDSTKWNYDIFSAEFRNGVFQKPVKLSDSINTLSYEADVFIAPDESYIIFCSVREEGYGAGDLYISFKEDEEWTPAQNMGKIINTSGHELCPFVTFDGKCLFYTSNKDIYWVSTDIIQKYRKTKTTF